MDDLLSAVDAVVPWLQSRYRTGELRFRKDDLAAFLNEDGFSESLATSLVRHFLNHTPPLIREVEDHLRVIRRGFSRGFLRPESPVYQQMKPPIWGYECLPGILTVESPGRSKRGAKSDRARRQTVGERMMTIYTTNRLSLNWTSAEWARHLQCEESSVRKTKTWRALEAERESLRQSSPPMRERRNRSVKH